MEDLQTICRSIDGSLSIEFTNFPFTITLTFWIVGTDKKVIFSCSQIEEFTLKKEAFDEPEYLCFEVSVNPPKKKRPTDLSDFEFGLKEYSDKNDFLWSIEILPEAEIKIKCLEFEWMILKMSKEEIMERNRSEN